MSLDSNILKEDANKVLDFIQHHYQNLPNLPVQPDVKPGFLRQALSSSPPQQGQKIELILQEIYEKLVPGMTNWHHPNFYAYFPSEASLGAVLGEILSISLNTPTFAWHTSPTATELENIIADWIVNFLGLPENFLFKNKGGGTIVNSVTEGYFNSINTAKFKKCKDLDIKHGDPRIFNLVAYYPESSQYWSRKNLFIKEIHHQRMLPMKISKETQNFSIDINDFEKKVEEDIQAGLIPFWFGASIGATATGANDDIEAIGKICQKHQIYLNVDAAYKGTQWVCPELREQEAGLQYVDLILINFAKNMMMGMNGCTLFVKDREILMESHGKNLAPNEIYKNYFNGEYDIADPKDWSIGTGKKFNALKFYVVFNYYGIQGMQAYARQKVEKSIYFQNQIEKLGLFEFPLKREIGLICFRLKQFNLKSEQEMIEINRSLLKLINTTDPEQGFISGQVFCGQYFMRFIVDNSSSTLERIDQFILKIINCTEQIMKQ